MNMTDKGCDQGSSCSSLESLNMIVHQLIEITSHLACFHLLQLILPALKLCHAAVTVNDRWDIWSHHLSIFTHASFPLPKAPSFANVSLSPWNRPSISSKALSSLLIASFNAYGFSMLMIRKTTMSDLVNLHSIQFALTTETSNRPFLAMEHSLAQIQDEHRLGFLLLDVRCLDLCLTLSLLHIDCESREVKGQH